MVNFQSELPYSYFLPSCIYSKQLFLRKPQLKDRYRGKYFVKQKNLIVSYFYLFLDYFKFFRQVNLKVVP